MGLLRNLTHGGKSASTVFWAVLFWIFCAWMANAAQAYTIETIPNVRLTDGRNHVSNPDGILLPEHVARMNALLNQLEDSLGIEVAVVAVESIGDHDARMFATDLFKYWGIGKKGEDNGLLIQLVTEPAQRSVVFETGYGIEGVLPDAICYRLQQRYMIPDLKNGNYSEGMLKGVAAVSRYLLESDYRSGKGYVESTDDLSLGIFGLLFIGLLVAISAAYYFQYRPRRCPRCGQKSFTYMGSNVIVEATRYREGLEERIYRCKKCGYTERHERRTDRLHGGGSGPIIMGGGGFGGFGGSGGGGSWGGGSSGGGGSMSRF